MRRGTGFLLLALLLAGSGGLVPSAAAAKPATIRLQSGQVLLPSLVEPGVYEIASIHDLGLVNPKARQTNRGRLTGAIALKAGIRGYPNRRFLRSAPRVACAAFVSWVVRQAGIRRTSNSASALYSLLLKQGGKLVAAKVNTRLVAYYPYYRSGDVLAFWKSSRRIGHIEVYVGGGRTVGTSSSAMHIGVRKLGNRGFRLVSVVRL